MKNKRAGFTLVELLVVIGILVLLLSITLIAINPARQFAKARNSKRQNDVTQISNAIFQNIAENHGSFLVNGSVFTIPTVITTINNTGAANICAGIIPTYIPALPQDPNQNSGAQITSCTTYDTGYQISRNAATGRITISSPTAEQGDVISITR